MIGNQPAVNDLRILEVKECQFIEHHYPVNLCSLLGILVCQVIALISLIFVLAFVLDIDLLKSVSIRSIIRSI